MVEESLWVSLGERSRRIIIPFQSHAGCGVDILYSTKERADQKICLCALAVLETLSHALPSDK